MHPSIGFLQRDLRGGRDKEDPSFERVGTPDRFCPDGGSVGSIVVDGEKDVVAVETLHSRRRGRSRANEGLHARRVAI